VYVRFPFNIKVCIRVLTSLPRCVAPVKKTIEAEKIKEGLLSAMKATKVHVCVHCMYLSHTSFCLCL